MKRNINKSSREGNYSEQQRLYAFIIPFKND